VDRPIMWRMQARGQFTFGDSYSRFWKKVHCQVFVVLLIGLGLINCVLMVILQGRIAREQACYCMFSPLKDAENGRQAASDGKPLWRLCFYATTGEILLGIFDILEGFSVLQIRVLQAWLLSLETQKQCCLNGLMQTMHRLFDKYLSAMEVFGMI
jgi:hypothetical protein